MKYKKKPVVIDAIQWTGNNIQEILDFTFSTGIYVYKDSPIYISTLEGTMKVSINDWIIKGVNGEFYPCKPDIFEATYEKVDL